jgi:hypothetical protein
VGYVDVDAEGGTVLMAFVAGVDPCLGDRGVVRGELGEELFAGLVVRDAGGGHDDQQLQTESVDSDAALAAHDLLAGIRALSVGGDAGRGLDGLRIDQAGGGLGGASCLSTDHPVQVDAEFLDGAVGTPGAEVVRASERSLRYGRRGCEEVMVILMHEVSTRGISLDRARQKPHSAGSSNRTGVIS